MNFTVTIKKNINNNLFEFEAECWEFAEKFDITRAIYSNSERPKQSLKHNDFSTFSWMFLGSDIKEQLQIKMEKNIGIYKSTGKVRKISTIPPCGL